VASGPYSIQRAAEARVGQVIAQRYRLGRLLGWGGMGMVFEAEHVTIRRPIAVKLLHSTFIDMQDAARRFEREAVTAGRLRHPNCVEVSDFGQLEDGDLYLVMELLTGRSLGDVLDDCDRLAPGRAIHIVRQVLRGLAHAHSLGVVHRDIKPDNVFLLELDGDPDFVKLLDFGIAKLVGDAAAGMTQLTQTGAAVGTPSYLAPEQVFGGSLDGRADLYSTTVVLYEMISGRTPFSGDAVAVVKQHLTADPPSIAEVAPDAAVSTHLARVIERGLAKSPEDRFASAEEYLLALDECPEAVGRRAVRPDVAPAGAPADAPSHFDIRPFLKRSWKWIAAGLGALIVAAIIFSAVSKKSRSESFDEALRQLESGERCDDRRAAVRQLRALGDPRAIPALRRARDRGAGRFARDDRDSNRCLAVDAAAAIDELKSRAASP
jgi:eukaryotic-like serine/threonine-protein kinase